MSVIPRVDPETFRFESPALLWLLAIPFGLGILWMWRMVRRRADVHRLTAARVLPVRERYSLSGDLAFWLAVLVAAALGIVAIAKPQARVSAVRRASADIVLLQDASASMHVNDVRPDRWRRSVRFLRTFAESLNWRGDRVALALFAQLAAPQVRLTKDPNSLFFFLDHLGDRSPFRLENLTTWDTNIEEGIRWGLNLIEKDEQLFGRSGNPKAFVVVSDGQSWSGSVANALLTARDRDIPVFVIGVGTAVGGMIPEPMNPDGTRPPAVTRAVLDRKSLIQIAVAGGGEYFEIGEEPDRTIAFRIVDRLRRRSARAEQVETFEDLYPQVLRLAAIVLCAGTLFLRKRTELAWQAVAALGAVLLIASVL
jgi:Ca-activated chloride channel family protein